MKYLIDSLRMLSMLAVFAGGVFGTYHYFQNNLILSAFIVWVACMAGYSLWAIADFCEPMELESIEEEWY